MLEKEEEERRRLASEEVAVLYYNLLSLICFFPSVFADVYFIWFCRWPRSRLRGKSSREQSLQQPGSLDHHDPRCHHCDHHHDHHLVSCRAVEKKRKTGSERSSPAVWAAVKVNIRRSTTNMMMMINNMARPISSTLLMQNIIDCRLCQNLSMPPRPEKDRCQGTS